jgi:hypothetical protein
MDKLKSVVSNNMDVILGVIFIGFIYYHSNTIYMYCDELFNLLSLAETQCSTNCEVFKNSDWRLFILSIKNNINQLIAVISILLALFAHYKRKHNKPFKQDK